MFFTFRLFMAFLTLGVLCWQFAHAQSSDITEFFRETNYGKYMAYSKEYIFRVNFESPSPYGDTLPCLLSNRNSAGTYQYCSNSKIKMSKTDKSCASELFKLIGKQIPAEVRKQFSSNFVYQVEVSHSINSSWSPSEEPSKDLYTIFYDGVYWINKTDELPNILSVPVEVIADDNHIFVRANCNDSDKSNIESKIYTESEKISAVKNYRAALNEALYRKFNQEEKKRVLKENIPLNETVSKLKP